MLLDNTRMRSAKPLRAMISRAAMATAGSNSQVMTSAAPARIAIIASRPVPVPISSTLQPGTLHVAALLRRPDCGRHHGRCRHATCGIPVLSTSAATTRTSPSRGRELQRARAQIDRDLANIGCLQQPGQLTIAFALPATCDSSSSSAPDEESGRRSCMIDTRHRRCDGAHST